jgi:hypothetical protein
MSEPDNVTPIKKGLFTQVAALVQRQLLGYRLGWMFKGERKVYEIFGYPQVLKFEQLLGKYERQDITSRIVDMPPEEMWDPPTLKEMRGVKEKWDDFANSLPLWENLIKADKLLSFCPFSVIFMGMGGATESPAPSISNPEDIAFMQAYGGDYSATVKTYEDNPRDPRFGQPVTYELKIGPNMEQSKTINVHHSRLIHIVDRPLQGLIKGTPRLAQIYNTLDDILKVAGGSAETFWLIANRGLQIDVDKEMQLDSTDEANLEDELDEYQHQLRRFIRTRGVKITTLGSDIADPRGNFEVLVAILAGTTSIPQRILMGSEAGQLASEQDRANWAEYMKRRRRVFGEPYVLKPVISFLQNRGFLPKDTLSKMKLGTQETMFVWPEAFKMSPLEDARTLAEKARATVNFARRNQFGDPVISDEEARQVLGLPDKPPAGDTMPKAPKPTGTGFGSGGPGAQPGASGTESAASTAPAAKQAPDTRGGR